MKYLHISMWVSSNTGNTKKIAEAVCQELTEMGEQVTVRYNGDCFADNEEADLYLLGFWTRKSTLNDMSKQMVDRCTGKPFLVFGTLGSYADDDYADRVRKNARSYVNKANRCLYPVFLSQGKIKESRTEYRRTLPKNAPHYLNDDGYRRHLESRRHPDEADLQRARDWIRDAMAEIESDPGDDNIDTQLFF